MATMKDVAERAGVSVATVSRVINQTGYVSEDLRQRVANAMKALNYQPSALARSLRRRETHTVGVLIPQIDQPFFGALAFAVEKTLFASGYHSLMCSAEESLEKEAAYIQMFIQQRVDGVILVPTGQAATSVKHLIDHGVPAVLVDRDLHGVNINRVLCDNRQGAYQAMRHLLELGHRRIGIIGAPAYSEPMIHRANGIRQALADFGLSEDPQLMVSGTLQQFEMGYRAANELLDKFPPPTAVFALTDVVAVGVIHAAAEHGLVLPRDLSIVGFDDIPLASFIIPELTTVAQPIYEMGEIATRMLLRHIETPEAEIETIAMPTTLIVRKSTAAPRM